MARSIYEAMGGAEAVLALAEAWHQRCLDDATASLNHRWSTPDEVPTALPLPTWDWGGTDGW